MVKDTLDKNLDITTLAFEGSSHTYLQHISGKNQVILTFTFYNINLPDSTQDKVNSIGFISYSIQPKKGVSKGTQIKNRAAIYFDFNTPVLTNSTQNQLWDTLLVDKTIIKGVIKTSNGIQLVGTVTGADDNQITSTTLRVYPNPAQNTLYISSSIKDKQYLLTDLSGKTIQEGILETQGNGTVDVSTLQRGVYLLKLGVSWVRVVLM